MALPIVAASATGASHCGPSPAEVGGAVLVALPVIFVAAALLQYLVLGLWSRRRAIDLRLGPMVVPLGATLVAAILFAPSGTLGKSYVGPALWLAGCSYLAVLTVATRLWVAFAPRRALVLGHLAPLLAFLAPAVVYALGFADGKVSDPEAWFILPGFGGWIAGPLYVAALIEAAVRGRRPLPQPPAPPAP